MPSLIDTQGIIDIHCHILPGLDDGCRSMEETIQVLQEANCQNVSAMIVTPHYHPGKYMVPAAQVLKTLESVKRQCDRRNLHIRLYPGQECFYFSGLLDLLDQNDVLTLANSRYVLVEFEPECMYSYLLAGLRELRSRGYEPILAHFERYRCLKNKEHFREVKEQGVLLQMNYETLLHRDFLLKKNPYRKMVQEGSVDFLGSDCHGMEFRPLQVSEAMQWVNANVDPNIRRRMLQDNIRRILR